jgi:hypothetical protein
MAYIEGGSISNYGIALTYSQLLMNVVKSRNTGSEPSVGSQIIDCATCVLISVNDTLILGWPIFIGHLMNQKKQTDRFEAMATIPVEINGFSVYLVLVMLLEQHDLLGTP